MSLNEEFDELARRKLEERAFPFQEADWQDARKLIDAERGGRNRAIWITSAVALLLISGLAWYGTRSARTEMTVATVEPVVLAATEVIAPVPPGQNESAAGILRPTAPAVVADVVAPFIKSISVHSVNEAHGARTAVHAAAEKSEPQIVVALNTSGAVPATMVPSKENIANNKRTVVADEESNEALIPLEFSGSRSEVHSASTTTTDPAANDEAIGPVDPKTGTTTEQDLVVSNGASSTSSDQPKAQDQQRLALSEDEGDKQVGGSGTKSDELQTKTDMGRTADAPLFMASAEVPARTTAEVTPSPTDTTSSNPVSNQLPGDSANAAAAAAPAPPPLVPERARWEVSIMGGVYSSTTTYSGSNSADRNADIGKESSFSVGAQLMHMGRNFGIGAGVHYGTYAERIRTDAIDATTTTLHNFWYLMPVDTMVLVITDTIPGTPPTFTGTSQNTTVNVLTQGTDTVTTTEQLRDARDQVNRVSYLEVPILLDAHLTQGRWMLGLRGGPTIGLLTGRRGSLPAPNNEGYVSFTDLPFRELTLGYTARAYVRYRFNAAWSMGLEPAMRGQLVNSMSSGDLDRRSSAIGVMLSLTYRLR